MAPFCDEEHKRHQCDAEGEKGQRKIPQRISFDPVDYFLIPQRSFLSNGEVEGVQSGAGTVPFGRFNPRPNGNYNQASRGLCGGDALQQNRSRRVWNERLYLPQFHLKSAVGVDLKGGGKRPLL
jgi:hypothetical protein